MFFVRSTYQILERVDVLTRSQEELPVSRRLSDPRNIDHITQRLGDILNSPCVGSSIHDNSHGVEHRTKQGGYCQTHVRRNVRPVPLIEITHDRPNDEWEPRAKDSAREGE